MASISETAVPPVVILHGKRADDADIRQALAAVAEEHGPVDVRVTYDAGDARSLAREAVVMGRPTVIASGGDGTLNEVADVLAREHGPRVPVFGVWPTGTANDFARSAGIPEDLTDALRVALRGSVTRMDVGTANDAIFINVATAGFGSEITAHTDERLKKLLGSLAYVVTGLGNLGSLTGHHAEVVGPTDRWEGSFVALAVGNGRQSGGGIPACPDAKVDDGLLDVTIVPELPEGGALVTALEHLATYGLRGLGEAGLHWRVPWVEVRCAEPMHLNLDGEPRQVTEVRFECRPNALAVRLPLDSPLLSSASSQPTPTFGRPPHIA